MIVTFDFSRTRTSLRGLDIQIISPAAGRYTFRFHFNARATANLRERVSKDEGAWFFRLDDITGTPLIRGRRVTVAADLLAPHHADPRVPPGVLRCEGPRDPWARDLGSGLCTLVYEE